MTLINTLQSSDNGTTSLNEINTNFANLNAGKIETSVIDTDGTLAANSDSKISSQKATKTYSDTKIPLTYLDTDVTLNANSDSKIPSQKAIKSYVNTNLGLYNVKNYGAKGDGSTNDQTAINNAVSAIVSAGTGTLYFPAGSYVLSTGIPLHSNMSVIGESKETTTIKAGSNSINLVYAVASSQQNMRVQNLSFDRGSKTSVAGISATYAYRITLDNLLFHVDGDDIYMDRGRGFIINDISTYSGHSVFTSTDVADHLFEIFIKNWYVYNDGTSLYPTSDSINFTRVVNGTIDSYINQDLLLTYRGIYLVGDCQGINISNCIIVTPHGGGIADGTSNGFAPYAINVSNCVIDQFDVSAYTFDYSSWVSCTNCSATGGVVRSNSGYAFNVGTGSYVSFNNCTSQSNNNLDFNISPNVNNFSIIGCKCDAGSKVKISVQPGTSDYYVISNNILHGGSITDGGSGTHKYIVGNV